MRESSHYRRRLAVTMTALVTPFRGHSVDYAAFDHLVEWQIDQGIEGLVLNSLTAEAPTLTETERRSLISRCVHISKGKIPIVVATGTNSTATTCDRTREAEHLGAEAVLIVQPYYNRPAQKGIIHHFEEVAKRTAMPILVQNDPGHAAVDMSLDTIHRLSQIPSVIGVVDDTADFGRIIAHRSCIDPEVLSFCSNDAATVSLLAQTHGSISSVANLCPSLVLDLHRAIRDGDLQQACEIDEKLRPLIKAVSQESTPAGLKQALSRLRGIDASVRLPLTNISDETAQSIFQALKTLRSECHNCGRSDLVIEAKTARQMANGKLSL